MKRTVSKLLGALLSAAVLLTPLAGIARAETITIPPDVAPKVWYADATEYVVAQGWLHCLESGLFEPNLPITRAAAVSVLGSMTENFKADTRYPSFEDVDEGQWYGPAVEWAKHYGLVSGVTDSRFDPEGLLTREQFAAILYRYAQRTGNDISAGPGSVRFRDRESFSPWALEAVEWACTHGVLAGYEDGTFRPRRNTTRAEMAMILWNARNVLKSFTISLPTTEAADRLGITEQNYPRIDGSRYLDGVRDAAYRGMFGENACREEAKGSGAAAAYQKLIDGDVDLVLAPPPSEEILEAARAKGESLDCLPLVKDALVFITPKENAASGIAEAQARQIYTQNQPADWTMLGGSSRALVPLTYGDEEDSRRILEEKVLNGTPVSAEIEQNHVSFSGDKDGILPQTAFYHLGGDGGTPTDSYALGYTRYSYFNSGYWPTSQLKILPYGEGNNKVPTEETVSHGTYPLSFTYCVVTRGSSSLNNDAAWKLAVWLRSEGMEELIQMGYLPVNHAY